MSTNEQLFKQRSLPEKVSRHTKVLYEVKDKLEHDKSAMKVLMFEMVKDIAEAGRYDLLRIDVTRVKKWLKQEADKIK